MYKAVDQYKAVAIKCIKDCHLTKKLSMQNSAYDVTLYFRLKQRGGACWLKGEGLYMYLFQLQFTSQAAEASYNSRMV